MTTDETDIYILIFRSVGQGFGERPSDERDPRAFDSVLAEVEFGKVISTPIRPSCAAFRGRFQPVTARAECRTLGASPAR